MGPKPAHLDLKKDDMPQQLQPPRSPFHMDLPSPRSGEAPPALSPLDAIAMHSRLLARKFEEPQNGRRISRLPARDVALELANRPGFFRSVSNESDMAELNDERPVSTQQTLVNDFSDKKRPMSHYPMFGNAAKPEKEHLRTLETPLETPDEFYEAEEQQKSQKHDYFGIAAPRAASPEPVDPKMINVQAASPLGPPSLTNSVDSVQSTQPRTLTNGSAKSYRSLAPPKSPAYPKSPRSMQSIRSVPQDSGDEDGSVNGSRALSSRKFSGSSGMSRPQSPFSPLYHPMHRSPSMTSANGSLRNFSRPLSSQSNRPIQDGRDSRPSLESRSSFETRPSNELHQRNTSVTSGSTQPSSGVPSRQASQDDVPTPFATATPGVGEEANGDYFNQRPTTSYVHSTYTLPRGRAVDRTSRGLRESWIQSQFTWDNEQPVQLAPMQRERTNSDSAALQPPPLPRVPSPASSDKIPQSHQKRIVRERASSSANRSRSAEPRTVEKTIALHQSTPSVRTYTTSSSERTIKAIPLHERSPSAELTAEEHLDIGIQTHSAGELNKSTYHLRLAAQMGLPTGMLLYALACRHGWGMRPNQEEGVRWLRKAIEGSGLEVADVEQTLKSATRTPNVDPVAEAQERRKRKQQFALAVYELGISYMNGWGCSKDKPLALSCYEVAGNWGDCDALAEAGFCYTQGVGCKKDLKKAAALYRKAAEGGMSMAGNSWWVFPLPRVLACINSLSSSPGSTKPSTWTMPPSPPTRTRAAATVLCLLLARTRRIRRPGRPHDHEHVLSGGAARRISPRADGELASSRIYL